MRKFLICCLLSLTFTINLVVAENFEGFCESEDGFPTGELWSREDRDSVEVPEPKLTAIGIEINVDSDYKLEFIPKELFAFCPNLSSIYIINSEGFVLENLEADFFETNYPTLTYFTSGECESERRNLKTIGSYAFSKVPNLIEVEIIYNVVETIAATAFSNNKKLMKISIVDNFVTSIDADLFKGLEKLQVIKFAANKLNQLPENIFQGLKNLQVVNFQQNQMKTLPSKLFYNLKNLTIINFSKNLMENLPKNVFDGLANLQKLNFSYNFLEVVNKDWFISTTLLRDIDFSYNRIVKIESSAFKNSINLAFVSFAYNQLTSIENNLFEFTKKLNSTDFSYNKISEIPANVQSYPNYTKIFSFDNQNSNAAEVMKTEWEDCPEVEDETWLTSGVSGVITTQYETIAQVPKICPPGRYLDFLGRCRFVSEK